MECDNIFIITFHILNVARSLGFENGGNSNR
jgi:hypothetical protein